MGTPAGVRNCGSPLVDGLLPERASRFPERGPGTGDAFDELYRQFDRIGGTHLVVFDEIDHLEDANTLLDELSRARANGHITDTTVGALGISADDTVRQTFSPTLTDTPMGTESSVSPCDAAALRTMLEYWAERPVVDEACDTSSMMKAAALAHRRWGNARRALDLLRIGADRAEQHGEVPVTGAHIEIAREQVHRGQITNKIQDQTEHA